MVKKKEVKSIPNKLHKYSAYYLVLLFILIRLIINIELRLLSIVFVIAYLIFLVMLVKRMSFFITLFIIFLSIDNMLAVYFFAINKMSADIFYGTIAVNFIIMLILLRNQNNNFRI